ncbi:MAG: cyanophycinase [candidate division KSB1 bacterium]|nr:cyanophycinase [candidate division KSB1 bacterium]MDZ7274641.1 cyanophycinase [candidate division KSB1 bacterium]MDZ7285466.1 cyanophycinase [candidate division KSB1 bacterium]MDZ7298498.1 cyanophycinase [candidate division KSB1 bacterium]MDZ7306278.1 cyanophycinase [candidate division KSB1 bacterium]
MKHRLGGGALVIMVLLSAFDAAGRPKGHLLIIGGGKRGAAIMEKFVELAGGDRAKVVVFAMASSYAHEVGPEQAEELRRLGCGEVSALNIDRRQADTDSVLALLQGVTGVFFSGGDQSRLTAVLQGTKVEARLHELYAGGAVLGGTSAGAAVMSAVMITGEERRPVADSTFNQIEADNIVTARGFGFLKTAIVDQHFVRRRRHNRLISLVLEQPQLAGLGIDEGTAIWVKPDQTFEVIGDHCVIVYDASKARLQHDRANHGLRASGVQMHVLRHGAQYDLKAKKVLHLMPR